MLGCLAVLAAAVVVLTQMDTPVRTAVGAAGVGSGSFPVAEVAGLGSDGAGFAKLTAALRQRGPTVVMVATPHHGSDVIGWETSLGDNPMQRLGQAMSPHSSFLDALGYSEPAGEVYTTIGGDPWVFRWLRHGSHGFDDQVPAESPFLTGAALDTFAHLHGRLLRSAEVVALVVRTLAAR